jgi:predicted DNA-binding WGR domain protein
MRYFECVDEKHAKYWCIETVGTKLITLYGKLGMRGQHTINDFGGSAVTESDKLITSKIKKGYREQIVPKDVALEMQGVIGGLLIPGAQPISPALVARIQKLVGDIAIDLNEPIEGDVDLDNE